MTFEAFCKQYNIAALNPQQEAAVKRVDGATLLLSVPGSGKTTVIVTRTGYMIHCHGIDPKQILTLTFTVAAANEMKERFLRKFNISEENAPHFSTIHSFCLKVLNYCRTYKGEHIPTLEPKNDRVVREICISMMPEYPSDSTIRSLTQAITNTKNRMLSWDEIKKVETEDVEFSAFYRNYLAFMQDNDLMDFDDQLVLAHRFLDTYPDVLEQYQEQYRFISVDEAQDTSLLQHKIIQMLAKKYGNIFMVGDDDQSIYGFRGAYPQALLSFEHDYHDAVVLSMETNYRSDSDIIKAANYFIKQNKNRHPKDMSAFSKDKGSISVTNIPDMREQHRLLLQRVEEYEGAKGTLAILYRNNESALPLLNILALKNKAVKCRDDSGLFFTHFIVRDITNYLNFALDPHSIELYSNLYFKMGIYLRKNTVYDIQPIMQANPEMTVLEAVLTLSLSAHQAATIKKFIPSLKRMATLNPVMAIDSILHDLNYQSAVIDAKTHEGYAESSLTSKINVLKCIAQEFETVSDFLEQLHTLQNRSQNKKSNITLSTLHSSKGLEFDKVIMIDAISGLLPGEYHGNSIGDLEEDVRLFYVGATRAKRELEFVTYSSAFGHRISPSRFIREFIGSPQPVKKGKEKAYTPSISVPTTILNTTAKAVDISEYQIGSVVKHKTFGYGTIVTLQEGGICEIEFQKNGKRKLDLNICVKNSILVLG